MKALNYRDRKFVNVIIHKKKKSAFENAARSVLVFDTRASITIVGDTLMTL